jgi:hypothetical protein
MTSGIAEGRKWQWKSDKQLPLPSERFRVQLNRSTKIFYHTKYQDCKGWNLKNTQNSSSIDLHINNCTALSVKILDNVPQCTPYSNFSL